jgi:hypothetical protein
LIPHDIEHPHLVVCRVDDHRHLLQEAERLNFYGVRFALFSEPDIPDASFRETALATEPIFGGERRLFKRFKLL